MGGSGKVDWLDNVSNLQSLSGKSSMLIYEGCLNSKSIPFKTCSDMTARPLR